MKRFKGDISGGGTMNSDDDPLKFQELNSWKLKKNILYNTL
jgi:hypothetical protein